MHEQSVEKNISKLMQWNFMHAEYLNSKIGI